MVIRLTQCAFSLVELSIVLVILGLLTGGILGGQALIRAAELRSLVTESQRYTTAVRTFQDKYFTLPGDMANATAFWGKSAADCNAQTGAAASPGTCNGNGDGVISYPVAAGGTGEAFRGWQHLALAGLIEGTYTGNAGSVSASDPDAGVNAPASRLKNGVWGYGYWDNTVLLSSYMFNYNMLNSMIVGSEGDNAYADGPLLRPEEAWNVDTKLDDGRPGTGRVLALNATACTNAAGATSRNADYRLADSGLLCSLAMQTMN